MEDEQKVNSFRHESDGWKTWIPYQIAFWAMFVGFSEFFCVLICYRCPFVADHQKLIGFFILLLFLIGGSINVYAYRAYSFRDEPMKELWKSIWE